MGALAELSGVWGGEKERVSRSSLHGTWHMQFMRSWSFSFWDIHVRLGVVDFFVGRVDLKERHKIYFSWV
jgi:hypothetical protein